MEKKREEKKEEKSISSDALPNGWQYRLPEVPTAIPISISQMHPPSSAPDISQMDYPSGIPVIFQNGQYTSAEPYYESSRTAEHVEPMSLSKTKENIERKSMFPSVGSTLKSLQTNLSEKRRKTVKATQKGLSKMKEAAEDLVGIVPESEEVKTLKSELEAVKQKRKEEEKRIKEENNKRMQEEKMIQKQARIDAVNAERQEKLKKEIEDEKKGIKPIRTLSSLGKFTNLFYDPNKPLLVEGRIGLAEEYTRLTYACKTGDIKKVRSLLSWPGIDVNKMNKEGNTPLVIACFQGKTEIVRMLLNAPGIDVNKPNHIISVQYGDPGDTFTPLNAAILRNNPEIVKMLLAAPGIDVNKYDPYGMSPLDHALVTGKEDKTIVKMLLAAPGIDLNTAVPGINELLQSMTHILNTALPNLSVTNKKKGGKKVKRRHSTRKKFFKNKKQ